MTFVVAAALAAALFAGLGVWQLDRLRERRARNAHAENRLASPATPIGALSRDSARAHYRRVRVAGTYDFAHEIVLVNRVHQGSPGVHIVTPVRPDSGVGADTVVLVDRGWVYSPDGATVDLSTWHEPAHLDGVGYVQTFPNRGVRSSDVPGRPDHLRWLDPGAVPRIANSTVVPYYVVLESEPDESSRHVPARDPLPTVDQGPHLSYAIQWFSFALIAIAGVCFAVFRRGASPGRMSLTS